MLGVKEESHENTELMRRYSRTCFQKSRKSNESSKYVVETQGMECCWNTMTYLPVPGLGFDFLANSRLHSLCVNKTFSCFQLHMGER